MQKVGGAIQRIDDPYRLVIAGGAAFLGENGVLGVVAADDGDDLPLGRDIDFGDEIVAALADTSRLSSRGILRAMTSPARRAARTAIVSNGCMTNSFRHQALH